MTYKEREKFRRRRHSKKGNNGFKAFTSCWLNIFLSQKSLLKISQSLWFSNLSCRSERILHACFNGNSLFKDSQRKSWIPFFLWSFKLLSACCTKKELKLETKHIKFLSPKFRSIFVLFGQNKSFSPTLLNGRCVIMLAMTHLHQRGNRSIKQEDKTSSGRKINDPVDVLRRPFIPPSA